MDTKINENTMQETKVIPETTSVITYDINSYGMERKMHVNRIAEIDVILNRAQAVGITVDKLQQKPVGVVNTPL